MLEKHKFYGEYTNVMRTRNQLDEFTFYDGYRKRIEAKLAQKNNLIARAENLVGTHSGEENQSLQTSLRRAIDEREELKLLLNI